MGILEYLKEREEYFHPEDEKEPLISSSIEEPNEFPDDEKFYNDVIAVKKIPDNSDPILDANEFLKPNAEIQAIYAKGQGFDLEDNLEYYEAVKLVKDMTDKNLYMRNMTWKVDIAHREAKFTFTLGDNDIEDVDEFFMNGIQQHITQNLYQKFGPIFKIDAKFSKNFKGQHNMELTIKKIENDEKERTMKTIEVHPRQSDSGNNIASTVTKM